MANPRLPKEFIDACLNEAIAEADREREQPTERQEQVKRALRAVLKVFLRGSMDDLDPLQIVRHGMTAQIRNVTPWEVSVAMFGISEAVLARYPGRDQATYNKRQLVERAARDGDADATLLVAYLEACDRWPDEE
jgi:hypothetical protein